MRRPGRMLCNLPERAHRASVLWLIFTFEPEKISTASASVIQSEAGRGMPQRSPPRPLEPDCPPDEEGAPDEVDREPPDFRSPAA
jgi:hypothetical protein